MISAIVLTKNSEKTIARTLESLSFADEIVVIDDLSNDATIQIVKNYTRAIYSHALVNDFSSQRNFALKKAKGEWVFFVDSDEVVPKPLAKEIQRITHTPLPVTSAVGYYIKRLDCMWGKTLLHGETGSVRLLRLARKDKGIWKHRVHEVWHIQGKIHDLHHPLLHYPHPDVAQFLSKINMYSTLVADEYFERKVSCPSWEIIVYPLAKFIRNYILHVGFLDGMPGLLVSIMMSFHSFLVRGKLYARYHQKMGPILMNRV
jgi:glycosyltransferase involved in cell wall biosynthesis